MNKEVIVSHVAKPMKGLRQKVVVASRAGLGVGASALEGAVSPLKLSWELNKDSHDKLEKVLAITPLVPPTLAALGAGLVFRDGTTALLVGGGLYYAEGTVYSVLVRFICPPDGPKETLN